MVQCLYFHIFIFNTIACSALLKLRLCKNLHSKTLLNTEICVRFSSNQIVVNCAVLFSIFGCGICVCALKRLEFSLRSLQLRFKLLRFWLRNSHLHFKHKNFGCGTCTCALSLKNFGCGICACALTLKNFGCGICACASSLKIFGCGICACALH